MIIVVVSDIHGFKPGFDWAQSVIEEIRPDEIWCLGDIVEGGGDDVYVVSELQKWSAISVKGNHDDYNSLELPEWVDSWLYDLPIDEYRHGWWLTHMSPRHLDEQIKDGITAWNAFDDCDFTCAIVGHSHTPAVYRYRKGMGAEAECIPLTNQTVPIDPSYRHLVVCPSLAYNRRAHANPGLLILNTEQQTIQPFFSDVRDMRTSITEQ